MVTGGGGGGVERMILRVYIRSGGVNELVPETYFIVLVGARVQLGDVYERKCQPNSVYPGRHH